MDIIGFIAKSAGTIVLTGTGVAAALLEAAAEKSGNGQLADLMSQGREGSFNTIKKMWNPDTVIKEKTSEDTIKEQIARREKSLSSLRNQAFEAKRNGNMELFEEIQNKMNDIRDEIIDYQNTVEEMHNYNVVARD